MKKADRFSLLKHEGGQSLVELAMALLVLIILISGIIDLGRILFYYVSMRDAAQEGLVYGSVYPYQCPEIKSRILAVMGDKSIGRQDIKVEMGLDNNQIQCDGPYANPALYPNFKNLLCSGQQIEITLTQNHFPLTMPLLGVFLGRQEITLSTSVKGTILRPACP